MIVDAYIPNGRHADLVKRVYPMILFGAPHCGLENTKLQELTLGKWPERLVSDLSPGSAMLRHFNEHFARASVRMEIVTCIEQKPTPESVALDNNPGRWKRSGPLVMMVDEQSACLYTTNENRITINENHSMIAKLSTSSHAYKEILRNLSIYAGGKQNPSSGPDST